MNDSYDLRKLKEVPHPLLSEPHKLKDNFNGISESEFERSLQGLDANEQLSARQERSYRQSHTIPSIVG